MRDISSVMETMWQENLQYQWIEIKKICACYILTENFLHMHIDVSFFACFSRGSEWFSN